MKLPELDSGAAQVAAVLAELALELFEQRDAIGRGAGKAADDLAVLHAPHLARADHFQ